MRRTESAGFQLLDIGGRGRRPRQEPAV